MLRIHLADGAGAHSTLRPDHQLSVLDRDAGAPQQSNHRSGGHGRRIPAVAVGELNPEGMILVHGEYWNARASRRVAASEPVRITGMEGLTLQRGAGPRRAVRIPL